MSSDKRYDALRRALEAEPYGPWRAVPPEFIAAVLEPGVVASLIADYDALTARVEAAERDARRLETQKAAMLQAMRRAILALAFAAETSPAMQDDYNALSAAIDAALGQSTGEME